MKKAWITAIFCFSICVTSSASAQSEFVRGDCNADGMSNIADTISLLGALFGQTFMPPCDDACDVNDDGSLDIADAVYLLGNLFSGGADPATPFPNCGEDATADSLDCLDFAPICSPVVQPTTLADIQPIFDSRCVGCHSPGGQGHAATGLDLSAGAAFSNLVNQGAFQVGMLRVTPGDPSNSYLWHKLNNTQNSVGGGGGQMPLGQGSLPAQDLALIEAWILEGANP